MSSFNEMVNTGEKQQPKFSVAISTSGYQKLIANTLRDPERQKRFVASITAAVAVNPELQKCDAGSILAGALLGESLNLSPSPQLGQYYLLPFNQREKRDRDGRVIQPAMTKAVYCMGYKGYIQLALRSGQYKDLDVMVIKEGEYLGKNKFTGKPEFSFIEDFGEWDAAPTVGYMAYFEYLNGFEKRIFWTKDKMLAHADKYSSAFSATAYKQIEAGEIADKDMWKYSSFWYKDFDGMAMKTMLRQLISKWGIMSTEMVGAFEKDNSIAEISNGEVSVMNENDIVDAEPQRPSVESVTLDEL